MLQGHPIIAGNSLRPIMLKAEPDTFAYIQGPFCKLANVCCRPAASLAADTLPVATSLTCAGFSFQVSPCPNIRDKVTWIVSQSFWKVLAKKPKRTLVDMFTDDMGGSLIVPPSLDAASFKAAQFDAYVRAIDTWNTVDGTQRERIPSKKKTVLADAAMLSRWETDIFSKTG